MTTAAQLPPAVADYFALMDSPDRAAVIGSFAPDAEVTDDGHVYRGRREISGWLTGAAGEYDTTSTRLSVDATALGVTVMVRVKGNFPGGQVDLRHEFTLDQQGSIGALAIAP